MGDDAPKPLTDTQLDKLAVKLDDLQQRRKTMLDHADTAAAAPSRFPVTAIVVGAAFTGFAGWQLYNHPPTAFNAEALWRIGCLVFGLACFPGVLPLAVKNLRGVVGLWKTFKANGSSGPAGG